MEEMKYLINVVIQSLLNIFGYLVNLIIYDKFVLLSALFHIQYPGKNVSYIII